jgi:hypothetical protein
MPIDVAREAAESLEPQRFELRSRQPLVAPELADFAYGGDNFREHVGVTPYRL